MSTPDSEMASSHDVWIKALDWLSRVSIHMSSLMCLICFRKKGCRSIRPLYRVDEKTRSLGKESTIPALFRRVPMKTFNNRVTFYLGEVNRFHMIFQSLRKWCCVGISVMTVADDTYEKLVFVSLVFVHKIEKLSLLFTIHCDHNFQCLPNFWGF